MAALTKLTTNINLEMSGDTKRYLVSAKQGDKATRFIIARLLNNGEPYTIPTGARAVINITKPDGKHVYNTCSYSGSDVTVELTNQALAASGTAYCDIEIRTSDDSQVITSASFTIEIEPSQKILESVQDYFNRAEALYSSMYLDCDGETPYLRTVTPVFIDGATPQVRNANEGVDFDGGTPTSRQLAV